MSYKIVLSDEFKSDLKKVIPKHFRVIVLKHISKLEFDPDKKGKPLGKNFIREFKLKKFRIYYIVSESDNEATIAAASDKKTQKNTIKKIILATQQRKSFENKNVSYIKTNAQEDRP